MQWFSNAPANIALIKYMGKAIEGINQPINTSLSYTLNHLVSNVSLESQKGQQDLWEPLNTPGCAPFTLSDSAQTRFLSHLAHLKNRFNYKGHFIVRSNNNFPQGCGLASSASSFAALTKCAVIALAELTQTPLLSTLEQANLSREGSGSSCRSFFSPWALWTSDTVKAIDLSYKSLIHQAVIISHQEKSVSSSEAHQRIRTSPHYDTRQYQARDHLKLLLTAFELQDWKSAYEVCWREFHNMHALFTSCAEPFSYMTPESKVLLRKVEASWEQNGDGPIVTMDAGPNVHLLYRPEQANLARLFKQDYLIGHYDVL